MRTTVAKWSEWIARGAVALGFALIGQTHAATITAAGVALTQGSGSSTCNYSQANESLSGDWSFTCGAGPATITISPNVNGTVCVTYGTMSEDMSGNWTIAGCVSAAPTLTLDAPVQSSSTYPSNVPFTLKATATPPTGRTISSVEFFHDGVSIHTGALSGSQYVWDWSPPSGTYQVTVRATDNTGAVVETSPAVQMTFAPAVGLATIYYIHPDHLGTPREITRASDNQIVWRWDNTESFGNSQPNENPSGLGTFAYNLRFPGQYFDAETGTNYNYFRDYDASIGRYIESDPIGLMGGINTYGYVGASPLINFDPLGLKQDCPQCKQSFFDCLANCIRRYDPLNNLEKFALTAGGGTFWKRWIGLGRGFGNSSPLTTGPSAAANAAGGGGAGTIGGAARAVGRVLSPIWIGYGVGMAGLETFCAAKCAGDNCAF